MGEKATIIGEPFLLDESIRELIVDLRSNKAYLNLKTYYEDVSVFEILGISRNENKHSNFLAWLLDPSASHGLGVWPTVKFLEALVMTFEHGQQDMRDRFPDKWAERIVAGACEVSSVQVFREYPTGGIKPGRIDILLSFTLRHASDSGNVDEERFCLVLENKIGDAENADQTQRYWDWLQTSEEYGGTSCTRIGVFLAPITNDELECMEGPECSCDRFIQMNYQYLVDYMLDPIRNRNLDGVAGVLVDGYLRTLSYPPRGKWEDAHSIRGVTTMATGERERALLKEFVDAHRALIGVILRQYATDENLPEEEKAQFVKVSETIMGHRSTKSHSKCRVLLEGKVIADNVMKTNIGQEVCKALVAAGLSREEFELLSKNTSSGFQLLRTRGEIDQYDAEHPENKVPMQRRYQAGEKLSIEFDGKQYYASKNWGANNLPGFIGFLRHNFGKVEIQLIDA